MFADFSNSSDPTAGRRFALSAGASVLLYAGVAAALLAAGSAAAPEVKKRVEVVFRPPPPPAEIAPAPPPPKPIARPPPPKTLKTVEVENLPPPTALVEPKEVPLEKPAEAEPTGEAIQVVAAPKGGYSYGTSATSAIASSEPIHLPESAQPPEALASNQPPEYPEAARSRSREGQVILKFVVAINGEVTRVEVLRGEEPFIAAAVAAVRRWKYRPAVLDGMPVAAWRIVKVPFRLRGG